MLFFISDYVICLIYKSFVFIQQKYAFIPKNDNIESLFLEKSCKNGVETVEKKLQKCLKGRPHLTQPLEKTAIYFLSFPQNHYFCTRNLFSQRNHATVLGLRL